MRPHRQAAKQTLVAFFDERYEQMMNKFPQAEQARWPAKEAIIDKVGDKDPLKAPIESFQFTPGQLERLGIEALLFGETVPQLLVGIKQNLETIRMLGPVIAGLRRRSSRRINQATSTKEMEKIVDETKRLFEAIVGDWPGFRKDPKAFMTKWESTNA
jgi:hypothetical protein